MRKDTNLILNELIQGENFTVRQDTNALVQAIYDGTATLSVNIEGYTPVVDENNNIDLGTGNTFTKTVTTADAYVAVEGGYQMEIVDSLDTMNFYFAGDITANLSTGMLFADLHCSVSGEAPWMAVGIKVANFSYDDIEDTTNVNFTDDIAGSWQNIYDNGSWNLDEATFTPGSSTTTQYEQCIVASDNTTAIFNNSVIADNFSITGGVSIISGLDDLNFNTDTNSIYTGTSFKSGLTIYIREPYKGNPIIFIANNSLGVLYVSIGSPGTPRSYTLSAGTSIMLISVDINGTYSYLKI